MPHVQFYRDTSPTIKQTGNTTLSKRKYTLTPCSITGVTVVNQNELAENYTNLIKCACTNKPICEYTAQQHYTY